MSRCKQLKGGVLEKAAFLLKGIIQQHPFASGNRRTALIAAKDFLISNDFTWNIPDNPAHAIVMQGIRENFYTNDEIMEWLKNGKIREFKR